MNMIEKAIMYILLCTCYCLMSYISYIKNKQKYMSDLYTKGFSANELDWHKEMWGLYKHSERFNCMCFVVYVFCLYMAVEYD